jgi:hypothetical protein
MLAKTAAKRLGVGVELVEGLIATRKIAGECSIGKSGETVWLIPDEEVDRLRCLIRGT